MQITFLLRKEKTNSKNLSPIQAVISFSGGRIRKNIKGINSQEKHWKNQRIKPNLKSEEYNYHIEYNKILDEYENKVKLIFRHILLNNINPSEKFITDKLNENNIQNEYLTPNFIDSFQEFIDTSKTSKAQGTIKKYTSTINFVKDFQLYTNYDLTFENINISFYEKFQDYAFEERNTLNNYFGRLIAVI
ncbi:MAG: phage integrase SAM-like domain-containing protein, partial [Aestuariibaculum sp.]